MNRLIAALAVVLVTILFALSAPRWVQADQRLGEHYNGSLGFHSTDAPLGIRWWFTGQKIGLDAGFGFSSVPAPRHTDEKLLSWAVNFGVPMVAKSWHQVHVLFRPGIQYASDEFETSAGPPATFTTDDQTTFDLTAEIEAEAFILDNFSVSASHGIGYRSVNPIGSGSSRTSFGSIGNNFTEVGFHVYFFGGHQ